MIKNIVFDVGRVLVSFEPIKFLKKLGYDEKTCNAVNSAMFANPLWDECDRGVLNKTELLQMYINNDPNYKQEITKAFETIGDMIELLPHTMKWLKNLKERGYKLYIISNYGEYTFEQTKHKLEFLSYISGSIFSYQYKIVKPDLEIYYQLLEEYNLKAEECVFIDDKIENVEAAKKVGYEGILFTDYKQTKVKLENILSQMGNK